MSHLARGQSFINLDEEMLDAEKLGAGATYGWLASFGHAASASVPTILTMVFFQMVGLLPIYFLGHEDNPDLLAGAGLGNMLLNVCVFAVSNGMNGTIETFVARAYGGGRYNECGLQLNRARILIFVILSPVVVIFFYVDKILIALAQDPTVSGLARNYVVWTLPGVFSLVQFDCMKRLLQTIQQAHISTATQFVTTAFHVGWCILFIQKWKMGIAGAACAVNVAYISAFLIQEFYVRFCARQQFEKLFQPLWSKASFEGWGEFLSLGVPGTLMQCFEWWCFELLAIFAGMLSVAELGAQIAVINILGLLFMIPLGVQFAASSLVGIQIGAGNPAQAKKYAICCILFALSVMGCIDVAIYFNEDFVSTLFTTDPETAGHIKAVLPILTIWLISDTIHGVQSGNVRALGKQLPASIVTLLCYYALGMPLAMWLGFTRHLNILGFWQGFLVSNILLDIIIGFVVICADWDYIADESKLTVNQSKEDSLQEGLLQKE